jgi:predicted O-linked N-acetylglucosamine transferase (SPINDLY family)
VPPVNPFSLLSIASTRAEQLQCARDYSAERLRSVSRGRAPFSFERGPRDRLRIGYLSANFHKHAIAYLVAELFELHDRGRFEICAYSYGPDDGSPMRARLKRGFDRFTDIASLSFAEAARVIHADGTDILVDLTGYTENARIEIAGYRPAPVQVHLIGYPGTLGADCIDYLIADRFVAPAAHGAGYHERLVRLPGSYLVNDRQRPIAATPPRDELGLPADGFVFCSFNAAYKIMPEVFAAWMRMLKGVQGSVLWLLEPKPTAIRNLRRMASEQGVDPARLLFAPVAGHAEHLGRLRAADLFLDTFPYNAHTTARDALWAGLPLLTCAGETFASRVAGSLLSAIGLQELITTTLADYEALGLRLARSPEALLALRGKLSRNRETEPLFDSPRYVRALESAYEAMWRNYVSGSGPVEIEI